MVYRSKDVGIMSEIQGAMYRLSNGEASKASPSWEFIRRYIVIDDLRNFLIQCYLKKELDYLPEYIPNLNLIDVDYMFITLTETKEELEVFNAFVKATGITNYFRTSYTKSARKKIQYGKSLDSVLNSEIKVIKPKKIMVFDNTIIKRLCLTSNLHEISDYHGMPCITTASIVKMLMGSKEKAGAYKAYMWSDFTKLKDYTA